MINLKWIQSLRCFYWLETNLWQILRQILDKILKDRAYEIPRNCEYDGYQSALASMLYKYLDKTTGSRISINEQQA